jgi:hypothetical protein
MDDVIPSYEILTDDVYSGTAAAGRCQITDEPKEAVLQPKAA